MASNGKGAAAAFGGMLANGKSGFMGDMDWLCKMCRERNFARRTDCFKCRVPRPPDAELVQAPSMSAPADGSTLTGMVKSYNKKGFGFIMVFGHNSPDVFYTRENVSQRLMHPDMPGEQVKFELFRERGKLVARNIRPIGDDCSKGGNKGMIGSREAFRNSSEEGQWRCPFCNEHNFARRLECFKCKVPKQECAPLAGFTDAPTATFRPPPPPRRTFSPHAGARAIKESMLAKKAEAAAAGGGGGGGGGSKSSASSSSSPQAKRPTKQKKRKQSSSSSSSKKRDKKKSKRKKRSSSSSRSRSRSSSSVVVESAATLAASGSGSAEIDKLKADALQQLTRLQSVEPKDVRMSEFRALLREWHPDKNLERVEAATAVFQFLQKGKALMRL